MNKIKPLETYIDILRRDFQPLKKKLFAFLDVSAIEKTKDLSDMRVMVLTSPYCWTNKTGDSTFLKRQQEALKYFIQWRSKYNALFQNSAKSVKSETEKIFRSIENWLEQKQGAGVPESIGNAKHLIETEFAPRLDHYLSMFLVGEARVFIYLDTNVLLDLNDFSAFQAVVEKSVFQIVLLSSVLSELDKLKNEGRSPDLREKAKRTIKIIKGLRDRGDILEGVTVKGSISISVISSEPDVGVLPWLDSKSMDDRIIASIFNAMTLSPGDVHALISNDINIQTKAAAAGLFFAEFEAEETP